MKNKIITLLCSIVMSLAVTVSCHAEELDFMDDYQTYLRKLTDISLVDRDFLHPDTKIVVTKDYKVFHGHKIKFAQLYFIKETLRKVEFAMEDVKAEKTMLKEMKKAYTDKDYYKHTHKLVDDPGFRENINEFENPFLTVMLVSHNSRSFGEKLTATVIFDTKIKPEVQGSVQL